jgi:uncharacterized delta-60 repeat protein
LLFGVARYTANGSLDPTFGGGGLVATVSGVPSGVLIQLDGKIIVVGNGFQGGAVVVRYNSNGSLDPTFGSGGEIDNPNTLAAGVLVQLDGKIVVVGSAIVRANPDGTVVVGSTIERYNPDGSPDTPFNTNASSALATINRLSAKGAVLQRDGKILLGGLGSILEINTPLIARLTDSCAKNLTFSTHRSGKGWE